MCLLQLFHTRARPEAYQYNNWSAPLCCWKYLSPTYQTKHLQWKATFPGFLLEFFLLKTCLFTDTHTNKPECVCSHACIHTHTSSFQGIRWIFVSLLPKINVARCVIVWARSHTCALYAFLCVFSLLSLHSYNLPTSPAICSPPVSSLSLCLPLSSPFPSPSPPLSLSDEQIELLNELFLWAPNAHPQLSICSFPCIRPSLRLPRLIHPPPPPHSFLPSLATATIFISTGTKVYACEHIYSHLCNTPVCTPC